MLSKKNNMTLNKKKYTIQISLGSESVYAGNSNYTIKDDILTFEADRTEFWMFEGNFCKIKVNGYSFRGYYLDGRTEGKTIHYSLV